MDIIWNMIWTYLSFIDMCLGFPSRKWDFQGPLGFPGFPAGLCLGFPRWDFGFPWDFQGNKTDANFKFLKSGNPKSEIGNPEIRKSENLKLKFIVRVPISCTLTFLFLFSANGPLGLLHIYN